MEIFTDDTGFCLGIARAYRNMNERALKEGSFKVTHQNAGGKFDTLTRIARRESELLAAYPGLGELSVVRDTSELGRGDRLVLGFHGLNKAKKQDLAARGVDLVDDLTCPFISKLDKVVERLAGDGFDIAIVGTKDNHHCRVAKTTAEEHDRRCFVIEKPDDIDAVPVEEGRLVALVGQVTGNTQVFAEVLERIRRFSKPIKIVKTMCSDSYARQKAAADVARQADVVILLDDGGGAAQSLFEVCSRSNKRVHRVRSKEEIQRHWFEGAQRTAVVGEILVPSWVIAQTARYIETICHEASGTILGKAEVAATGQIDHIIEDMTAAAPIDIIPRPPEDALPWEKLSVALVDILGGMQQIVTVDELTRADAALGDSYRGLSSFERLTQTAVNVLIAKGLVDEGDLRVRMARLAVTLAGDKDRAHPKARFSNAGVNDIGGLPGGPIDRSHHEEAGWEKLIVALGTVLSRRRLRTVHESRRAIEELGDDYNRLAYFERTAQALANLLYEKGVLNRDEVAARMDTIRRKLRK